MKKTSRREQPGDSAPRNRKDSPRNGTKDGRWEFITTGSIFTLGSNDTARRAAYRTATGELRFLPL